MLGLNNNLIGKSVLEDVYSIDGQLLIGKGVIITDKHMRLMDQFIVRNSIKTGEAWEHKVTPSVEYKKSVQYMNSIFQLAAKQKMPSYQEFRTTFSPLIREIVKKGDFVPVVNDLREHDAYTYAHSVNVGFLCAMIGRILNLSEDNIILLGEIGLIHDIGKSKIDLSILNKSGALTPEEYTEMKRHTKYGFDLLKDMKGCKEEIRQGALLHHERLDGSGYPLQLNHKVIPWFIQVLMIADLYDAIVTRRPYKDKETPFFAVQELRKEAFEHRLNPKIVIPFFAYILRQYIHSRVILNDNSIGEIIYIFEDYPNRPIIRVDSEIIDLRKHPEIEITEIKQAAGV